MDPFIPDVDMADAPVSDASANSSLPIYESPMPHYDPFDFNDDDTLDFVPDAPFAELPELAPELIACMSGDANPHPTYNNSGVPAPHTPSYDPGALLNPKAANAKRPASSGGDQDRGRAADHAFAGQVSLVERLHNVQERTSSPAKRVKTDENRKKTANGSGFGGGSALELQNSNGNVPAPQSGPVIDLTMGERPDS
jgi:hypothetical protein